MNTIHSDSLSEDVVKIEVIHALDPATKHTLFQPWTKSYWELRFSLHGATHHLGNPSGKTKPGAIHGSGDTKRKLCVGAATLSVS